MLWEIFLLHTMVEADTTEIVADIIARKELLACLVSILCFEEAIRYRLVRLHTDNSNVYHWLRKSRSPDEQGTKFLALWEYGKYMTECKIAPVWIPSDANVTADQLSRGSTPAWLKRRGVRRYLKRRHIILLNEDPIKTWLSELI